MSFSKSFSNACSPHGIPADQQAAILDQLHHEDQTSTAAGHQQQARLGFSVIDQLAHAHVGKVLAGTISGHANPDGSGSLGVTYRIETP